MTLHRTRGPYQNLSHLVDLLSRVEVEEKPPRPGDVYLWECGCQFQYAVGVWRQRTYCTLHKHLEHEGVGI